MNTSELNLNLAGFNYEDLYLPERLPVLDRLFRQYLGEHDRALAQRFEEFRAGALEAPVAVSSVITESARHLENFLVEAFGVSADRDALRTSQENDSVIQSFKNEFVKPCLKRKAQGPGDFDELDGQLQAQLDQDLQDRELAVAILWKKSSQKTDTASLALLEAWCRLAATSEAGRMATKGWTCFNFPAKVNHLEMVPLVRMEKDAAARVMGKTEHQRRRDGFNLTDKRFSLRQAMDQVHYCVYCHSHEGDYCSKGLPDKETGRLRTNPLGVELTGCPLGERISEAHMLKREGYTLGALAAIVIDNPLVPATGHRICNDCMKSCIYQKQDPVDIPQIETRILTDVLHWRWGFEIYFLLTRWNPLNRERPYAEPNNGLKILCVGMGPAGFNLSYHLTQAGFGVVAVDGLKIEPLPSEWVGGIDQTPNPIARVEDLFEPLDDRVMSGFGGVAEYGITIRWDKNFLKLVHLVLARNALFRVYGGVRLGGTLTLEDASELGFDHVALATGAGRPTVIPIKNGLARGIRQASDFLMALQLTGAAKKSSLSNLQVRLPALVIGGGLTAIDTATEVQAYYVRQVEKILERHEAMPPSGDDSTKPLTAEERDILDEYLSHGREIRAERERARWAGESPDFTPLLQRWGGVTVVYRRPMNQSPAYLRNHEEIAKAFEEGIFYAEELEPVEAKLDQHGHVSSMLLQRTGPSDRVGETLEISARAVFIAAGSIPNTVYEREHPGTFRLDGKYFATHRVGASGELEQVKLAGGCKAEKAEFLTSYTNGKMAVSIYGDNHPQFNGSVVKAMASGKRGAKAVRELLDLRITENLSATARVHDANWQSFAGMLDRCLRPNVVAQVKIGRNLVRLTIKAPQAAKNWQPGQVYRLQNYETRARRVGETLLQMEGMAIDGIHVDKAQGEISLLVNEVGTSSKIAGQLAPGEPVVLMGPTGTGLPGVRNKTVTLIGGHSAATSAMDGSVGWREAGCRVVFIGRFASRERAEAMRPVMEACADQVIWVLDSGPALESIRPQDFCFVHGLDTYLQACRNDDEPYADWVRKTDTLLVSDHPTAMERIAEAVRTHLKPRLKTEIDMLAVVNSPMQCMMKEVCAQCLCRHKHPETGEATQVVFSCFNQHQPLLSVDFENLKARQGQNSLQEKLGGRWLSLLLEGEKSNEASCGGTAVPVP